MWYIILSHSLPEREESKQQNYEEHRQWLDEQHRLGRLLFSGPTADRGLESRARNGFHQRDEPARLPVGPKPQRVQPDRFQRAHPQQDR